MTVDLYGLYFQFLDMFFKSDIKPLNGRTHASHAHFLNLPQVLCPATELSELGVLGLEALARMHKQPTFGIYLFRILRSDRALE